MKPEQECRECIFKWVYERTEPYISKAALPLLADRIMGAIKGSGSRQEHLGSLCNRAVYSTRGIESGSHLFYRAFKEEANREAARILPAARAHIEHGNTERERLERALAFAAAGNVSPLGALTSRFTFPEIEAILQGSGDTVFRGDPCRTVEDAGRILYITDNAGEVGFDSLLLEFIKKRGVHVTLVIKDDLFFEDAGIDDVLHFGLEDVVDVIAPSKGFFSMSEAGPALEEAYCASDVIIGKGTGSFEALHGETMGKGAVFMLKVKCGPISRSTGVEQGRVLVTAEA